MNSFFFKGAVAVTDGRFSVSNNSRFALEHVQCRGEEENLLECLFLNVANVDESCLPAGVICEGQLELSTM